MWETWIEFPALVWPNPSHCRHLGRKLAIRTLYVHLSAWFYLSIIFYQVNQMEHYVLELISIYFYMWDKSYRKKKVTYRREMLKKCLKHQKPYKDLFYHSAWDFAIRPTEPANKTALSGVFILHRCWAKTDSISKMASNKIFDEVLYHQINLAPNSYYGFKRKLFCNLKNSIMWT